MPVLHYCDHAKCKRRARCFHECAVCGQERVKSCQFHATPIYRKLQEHTRECAAKRGLNLNATP